MMADTKYPLWCIMQPEPSEHQYIGPFAAAEDARAVADSLDMEGDLPPGSKFVRCRRLKPSECPAIRSILEDLVEMLDEGLSGDPPTGTCWGNWDETLVKVIGEGGHPFLKWADDNLEINLFETEGVEQVKEGE